MTLSTALPFIILGGFALTVLLCAAYCLYIAWIDAKDYNDDHDLP